MAWAQHAAVFRCYYCVRKWPHCELGASRQEPSANLAVDPTPLFNGTSCIQDFPVCVDTGTECGNSCEIPYDEKTCSKLATVFGLSYSRFSALNPALLCTADKEIALGTSVCMGGTCGD